MSRFALVVTACLVGSPAAGQTIDSSSTPAGSPAPASHKHYEVSEQASQPGPGGELAPRLQSLGSHTFPVSTKNADAQAFMNQGLNLAYAFNHAEARRAFREAARLDPTLAMAYWGQALVLGPNINAMMEPNDEPHADELVKKALSLARQRDAARAGPDRGARRALLRQGRTPRRRQPGLRRRHAGRAHAVPRRPRHRDVLRRVDDGPAARGATGCATGSPHAGTAEIVALTEDVMRRNPKHPGALHMYIHLMESVAPEKAEAAADALLPLLPDAGHMVHMPAHIYQRVGRYADAMKSNELAIKADESYIAQCRAQGLYPMAYYPHNIHFLWFAASADGQSKAALDAARKVAAKIDDKALAELADHRRLPRRAVLGDGALRQVGRDPEGAEAAGRPARSWSARGTTSAAWRSWPRASSPPPTRSWSPLRGPLKHPSLDGPMFSPNPGRAILGIAPHRPGRRDRRGPRQPTRRRSRRSSAPCASTTRWSTPSRASSCSRRGSRSARSCCRPADPTRRRRSTGRT